MYVNLLQSDFLMIEDDSGRMRLRGMEAYVGELVTGVVLAFKGRVLETGDFQVRTISILVLTCIIYCLIFDNRLNNTILLSSCILFRPDQ